MDKRKGKFYVDHDGLFAHGTIIFLILSAAFSFLGSIGKWNDRFFTITQVLMPAVCAIVYVVFFVLFGHKALWTTAIPVIPGMAFFIMKEFSYGGLLYTAIAVTLAVITAFLYLAAVFGWIKTKIPQICVLVLGFFYHIYIRDYAAISSPDIPVSFSDVMQEMAIIFIILGLLSLSFAMKNTRSIEQMNLPKIKPPRVIIGRKKEENTAIEAPVKTDAPEQISEPKPEVKPEADIADSPEIIESAPVAEESTSPISSSEDSADQEKAEKQNAGAEPGAERTKE